MKKRAGRLFSATVVAVAGIYLLIALLNSIRPVIDSSILTAPGRFLYYCFLEASFYLPLLFLISSFFLFADFYNSRVFFAKLFSLVPFFTLSLILRLLNYIPGSRAADAIIGALGIRGGTMVLGLLLIPEMMIFLRILVSDRRTRSRVALKEQPASENLIEPDDFEDSETGEEEEESRVFEPVPLDLRRDRLPVIEEADEEAEDEPDDAIPEDLPDEEAGAEIEELDSDDEVFEDLSTGVEFDEDAPVIEPLDLDPSAGEIDENEDLEDIIEEVSGETESELMPRISRPAEDESYPDAPVRGDEDAISKAARDVWADAEQLGFDDVIVEEAVRPEVSEYEDEDEDQDIDAGQAELLFENESDQRLDIDGGQPFLTIPDVNEEPSEEMVTEYVEGLDDTDDDSGIEFLEDAGADNDPEDELEAEIDFEDEVEDEPEEIAEPEEVSLPAPAPRVRKPKKYTVPVENLLQHYEDDNYWIVDEETKAASEILRETLEEFKIAAEVTGISKGPVITMFEILPAPGVKLSKIVNLADNIALRLAASRVRIVAPIPGKHAVGIEVPNKNRAIVSFREIIESEDLKKSRMSIPVVLGKDITGGARIIDLVQTPHLLIAGATGSGKSVCVNSLICSVLYSRMPDEVKLILIDPKIVELKMYNDIPHLLTPVITEPKKAFQALQYAMCEMERRYSLLNALGVRDIKSYNRKIRDARLATDPLPYIVIIVDEFADLMATTGKELENVISRLAAMSRAIGIHLVLATQRPSVDVITGLIKANIPSRIAFMVASKTDSRIIIDSMGADKLLGKGDMLFTSAWDPNPVRIQGAFLSDDEVERVTDHVKTLGEPDYIDDEIFISDDGDGDFELESAGSDDPLMDPAVQIVVEAGKASASYLQRRLKIGYNRAARLVEEMEDRGIVGPANGSKPREIIHIPDRV